MKGGGVILAGLAVPTRRALGELLAQSILCERVDKTNIRRPSRNPRPFLDCRFVCDGSYRSPVPECSTPDASAARRLQCAEGGASASAAAHGGGQGAARSV